MEPAENRPGDVDGAGGDGAIGPRPPLTVVVPTRDRVAYLEACLAALRGALGPEDELIVVDSASVDAEGIAGVASAAGAAVVRCAQPGASRARNAGARAARHEIVAFVDDDVRVEDSWAEAMALCFARDPDVAFVTGRIETPDGRRYVAIIDDQDAVAFERTHAGKMGHSASLAVRRTAFDEVGGFDVALGAGARFRASEDGDLLDRMLIAGHRGRHEPLARAWHEQWRSRAALVRLNYAYGIGAGAALAKLRRLADDRARLRRSEYLSSWGLGNLARAVRDRAKLDALTSLARLGGMAVGFARGAATPVAAGHFRSHRRAGI
ncbi:MAG: glycosyltransferase family 2 protein [Acidimicrobiales bacterium]